MIILAIDSGDSRTGIAVCDKDEILASPVTVIKGYPTKIIGEIQKICDELHPELIVVGNPVNMDGSCGERSLKCSEFAKELENRLKIKTVMWDERRTTVTANGILNETNVRGKKRKSVIDAVAAVVILESYLAYRKNFNAAKI